MSFIYTKQFTKDRRKLSKSLQNKVTERLQLFLENPSDHLLNNHDLNPPWKGYKSINITGDIRQPTTNPPTLSGDVGASRRP